MAVVLTNVGEDWASQRMAGSGADSALSGQYVGWGTGAGTAAKADTSLFTENGSRVAGTVSVSGTEAPNWAPKVNSSVLLLSLSSQVPMTLPKNGPLT